MFYFKILVKLLPFLFSLVKTVEIATDKEKAGPEKKEAVKDGIMSMFEGAKEVSTGGQKETLEAIGPLFDTVIDKGLITEAVFEVWQWIEAKIIDELECLLEKDSEYNGKKFIHISIIESRIKELKAARLLI